jgi:hypothetical protein
MNINVKNVGILLKNSNPLQQIPLKNAKAVMERSID